MSVIFLTGVHGVGKGYLGAPVAKSLGMDHFTASQLIREEKGRATWGADKRVAEVDDNQAALIRAVHHHRELGHDILLDGHFVLRGMSGELVRLERDVFANLQLSGVILLTEDAQIIAGRLVDRDGIAITPESISDHAAEVYAHVNDVCSKLNVPLVVLDSANLEILSDAVVSILRNQPAPGGQLQAATAK